MAAHSSALAWRIPGAEEPGGYGPQGRKDSDMTEATQHTCPVGHLLLLMESKTILRCRSVVAVVVQSLNCVRLFATPWAAAGRLLCPSPSPGIGSNSCPLSW